MLQMDVEVRDNYIYCKPNGEIIPGHSMHFLRQLLNECRAQGLNRLIINVRWASIEKTSFSQQFLLASQISNFWDKRVKVAIVGLDDAEPFQFSTLVLKNRGVTIDAFTNEADGMHWLLSDARAHLFSPSYGQALSVSA